MKVRYYRMNKNSEKYLNSNCNYWLHSLKREMMKNIYINITHLIKLSTVSGKDEVSLTQVPGLGSGTLLLMTGNQAELEDACSLNFPSKAFWMSPIVKVHMAEPMRPVEAVVKTP